MTTAARFFLRATLCVFAIVDAASTDEARGLRKWGKCRNNTCDILDKLSLMDTKTHLLQETLLNATERLASDLSAMDGHFQAEGLVSEMNNNLDTGLADINTKLSSLCGPSNDCADIPTIKNEIASMKINIASVKSDIKKLLGAIAYNRVVLDEFGYHQYGYNPFIHNRESHQQKAAECGAKLATIVSEEHNVLLANFAHSITSGWPPLVGGYKDTDDTWKWEDVGIMTYTNWPFGDPNPPPGTDLPGYCTVLSMADGQIGLWFSENCTEYSSTAIYAFTDPVPQDCDPNIQLLY